MLNIIRKIELVLIISSSKFDIASLYKFIKIAITKIKLDKITALLRVKILKKFSIKLLGFVNFMLLAIRCVYNPNINNCIETNKEEKKSNKL